MSRPLRLDAPGEFFHVMARGIARAPIFEDEFDRRGFLELLAEVVDRFGVHCHSYCLMGNHYHLILQPSQGGLPRAMRHLNGVHAARLNRRHGRTGHAFEGRYLSLLVDRERYLLALVRYVARNPVRARLVHVPAEWPWSSCAATSGAGPVPGFLTVEFLRRAVAGRGGAEGAADFAQFVTEEDELEASVAGESLAALAARNGIAGGPGLVSRYAPAPGSAATSQEIPRAQRLAARPPLATILGAPCTARARDRAIREAVLVHRYAQADVARFLQIGRSTVSRAVHAAHGDLRGDRRFPES